VLGTVDAESIRLRARRGRQVQVQDGGADPTPKSGASPSLGPRHLHLIVSEDASSPSALSVLAAVAANPEKAQF